MSIGLERISGFTFSSYFLRLPPTLRLRPILKFQHLHITTPIVYPKSSLCSLPLLYRSSSYSSPFRCSILFPVPLSFLFLTIAPNPFVLPSSSFLPTLAIVSSSLFSPVFLFSNPLILISSSRLLPFLSSHGTGLVSSLFRIYASFPHSPSNILSI